MGGLLCLGALLVLGSEAALIALPGESPERGP